jgi:hypothetical protein
VELSGIELGSEMALTCENADWTTRKHANNAQQPADTPKAVDGINIPAAAFC